MPKFPIILATLNRKMELNWNNICKFGHHFPRKIAGNYLDLTGGRAYLNPSLPTKLPWVAFYRPNISSRWILYGWNLSPEKMCLLRLYFLRNPSLPPPYHTLPSRSISLSISTLFLTLSIPLLSSLGHPSS